MEDQVYFVLALFLFIALAVGLTSARDFSSAVKDALPISNFNILEANQARLRLCFFVLVTLKCSVLYIRASSHLIDGKSSTSAALSGVPQGTALGLLLLLIYINEFPLNISPTFRLFADDCVIYLRITTTGDLLTLQDDPPKLLICTTFRA